MASKFLHIRFDRVKHLEILCQIYTPEGFSLHLGAEAMIGTTLRITIIRGKSCWSVEFNLAQLATMVWLTWKLWTVVYSEIVWNISELTQKQTKWTQFKLWTGVLNFQFWKDVADLHSTSPLAARSYTSHRTWSCPCLKVSPDMRFQTNLLHPILHLNLEKPSENVQNKYAIWWFHLFQTNWMYAGLLCGIIGHSRISFKVLYVGVKTVSYKIKSKSYKYNQIHTKTVYWHTKMATPIDHHRSS